MEHSINSVVLVQLIHNIVNSQLLLYGNYLHIFVCNIGMWLNVSVTQSIITGYLRHLGSLLFLTQVFGSCNGVTAIHVFPRRPIFYIIIYMRIRVIHYLASVLIWHQYLFIWREVAYHRKIFWAIRDSRQLVHIKKTVFVGRAFHGVVRQ